MGNIIFSSNTVYLNQYQVAAAHNTQPKLWPPVPIKTEKPYLANIYLPIETAGLKQLEPDYVLGKIGGPEVNGVVMAYAEDNPTQLLFRFGITRRSVVRIAAVSPSEAIMMGLVSVTAYRNDEATGLIKAAWDAAVSAPELKYDKNPLAFCLGLRRLPV